MAHLVLGAGFTLILFAGSMLAYVLFGMAV